MTSLFPDVTIKLSAGPLDHLRVGLGQSIPHEPNAYGATGPRHPDVPHSATLGGRLQGIGGHLNSIRSMAGLGAGLGFAKGLIAPGTEYDEYGRPRKRNRAAAALGNAATGAALGTGLAVGSKVTGAGNALAGYGKRVDAGTSNAPDWLHAAHEGIGGGQSAHRANQVNPNANEPTIIPGRKKESQMQTASKVAALRLVRDDIYLVADINGEGFIGTYKGASADDRAVFQIHAPGIASVEAAFDMRKLAHISPVLNTKTGAVARSRDELPFTHEGQKLAEAYAYKVAKRVAPAAFAAHQFKKKDTGAAATIETAAPAAPAPAATPEKKEEPAAAAAPAAEPAASATMTDTSLPKLRAKAKAKK